MLQSNKAEVVTDDLPQVGEVKNAGAFLLGMLVEDQIVLDKEHNLDVQFVVSIRQTVESGLRE